MTSRKKQWLVAMGIVLPLVGLVSACAQPSDDTNGASDQALTNCNQPNECAVKHGPAFMSSVTYLQCTNRPGAMFAQKKKSSQVVDQLKTTSSWFYCWGEGELHEGGNHTWYYTEGDQTGQWGWVPAAYLNTEGSFDTDPVKNGLYKCQFE